MPTERESASEAAGFTPDQIEEMVEKVTSEVQQKLAAIQEREPITDSPRWPNIKLEGKRIISTEADETFYADGLEFFLDEHGYQWVKFTPKNGPHEGKEHCLRTEKVRAVIDNRKA
jgi:hypothetical protein